MISNILSNIIVTKLKIDNSKLKEEKLYANTLLNQYLTLNRTKDFKMKNNIAEIVNEDFLVSYTITISFLKSNTIVCVSDIKGKVKLFYSSGSVDLVGKQKKNRVKSVSRLISLLIKKALFIKNYPVAVHLYNVSFHKSLIINKLKTKFFIKVIKSFNKTPYNGCRKKKIRRKKYVKKFK